MKHLNAICLLVACLFISATSFSQSSLSGNILDETGAGLPFANILLLNGTDSSLVKGTTTDTAGVFQFQRIPKGNYIVSAQMLGYEAWFSESFLLGEGHKNLPTQRLNSLVEQLGEVSVTAARPLLQVTPNAMVVNVSASALMASGNAHQVLEKSPGITVDQDGNISLKGKSNVLVYIDGKPTYLSNADLVRMLQSTPAESIEKVEIMDNPPAKYDASGNAGIINIVRKRDASLGMNGNVSLNLGYGTFGKATPSLNLNYKGKKLGLFGSYSYNWGKRFNDMSIYRRIPYGDETSIFDQKNERDNWVRNNNFRLGADLNLSKTTTVGVMLSGNIGTWDESGFIKTQLAGVYPNEFDYLNADTRTGNDWNNLTYNFNIKQKIGAKGDLTFDADYVNWGNGNGQLNQSRYFLNDNSAFGDPYDVKTASTTDIDIIALKTDYSVPLTDNLSLETGFKSSNVKTDNELDFRERTTGDFIQDLARSNQFSYTENIQAGYVNVSTKFGKKWSVQAGLRGENTYSKGYSATLDSTVTRTYFNVFPSVSASFNEENQYSLSFSYSRRIDRPNYENLNPFEFFLDQFTFGRGNPFLQPQFTDAYGITYGIKNMVFITLNYNDTKEAITQVLLQDEEKQATYQTTVNLNRIRNYSVNVAAPVTLTKWWNMNLNLTGFMNKITSPFEEGDQIDQEKFTVTGRVSNTFSLPKGVKVELMGFYQSPMVWGIFEMEPQYQVDLSASKSFGPLRAQLSFNDVFNIRDFKGRVYQGDIKTDFGGKWESRVVRLNLSYAFGNQKVRMNRRRGTASDDLQQRANSGN